MLEDCSKFLSNLSMSVDAIDEHSYGVIIEAMKKYFSNQQACFFDILLDGSRVVNDDGHPVPGLSSIVHGWTIAIFTKGDEYTGQRTYAYHRDCPLWVTASDQKPLIETVEGDSECVDSWSHAADLPPYKSAKQPLAKTSILVPMKYGDRVFGVMVTEFNEHIKSSTWSRQRIEALARAIGRIIWQHETTKHQIEGTQTAIKSLANALSKDRYSFRKPSLFFASPGEADEEVVEVVTSVLQDFADHFDLVDWRGISQHGSITEQLSNEIFRARYAVCYLSQRVETPDAQLQFVDNGNVLFEAGMLHALRKSDSAAMAWIPVREAESVAGRPPFDISQERTVIVPRHEDRSLDRERLADNLRCMLESVVEHS